MFRMNGIALKGVPSAASARCLGAVYVQVENRSAATTSASLKSTYFCYSSADVLVGMRYMHNPLTCEVGERYTPSASHQKQPSALGSLFR